jgi:hypothetical protein
MPRISSTRLEEKRQLEPLLAVLNRAYQERPSTRFDPEDVDGVALATEESKLRKWVGDWCRERRKEDDVVGYIYRHPVLKEEFFLLAAAMGIPKEMFSRALAFQRRLSDEDKFNTQVKVVASMLEYGFDISAARSSRFFGASEAMYLFLLLRLPLAYRLARCWCKRYFLNLGGKAKCCCRSHAQALVNRRVLSRLQKERDAQKRAKLKRARRALTKSKSIAEAAKRTGLSLHFITRAINRKELKPPRRQS